MKWAGLISVIGAHQIRGYNAMQVCEVPGEREEQATQRSTPVSPPSVLRSAHFLLKTYRQVYSVRLDYVLADHVTYTRGSFGGALAPPWR